jgi:hypothetical protein
MIYLIGVITEMCDVTYLPSLTWLREPQPPVADVVSLTKNHLTI